MQSTVHKGDDVIKLLYFRWMNGAIFPEEKIKTWRTTAIISAQNLFVYVCVRVCVWCVHACMGRVKYDLINLY